MEVLPAPLTTKSGHKKKAMSKQKRSLVIITCKWCGQQTYKPKKGKTTAQFCNRQCASRFTNNQPEIQKKIRLALVRPSVVLVCQLCSKSFNVYPHLEKKRRFCSRRCADSSRRGVPHSLATRDKMSTAHKGMKKPWVSTRMKEFNKLPRSEKHRRNLGLVRKGKTFLGRGGKPKITEPQQKLATYSIYLWNM